MARPFDHEARQAMPDAEALTLANKIAERLSVDQQVTVMRELDTVEMVLLVNYWYLRDIIKEMLMEDKR